MRLDKYFLFYFQTTQHTTPQRQIDRTEWERLVRNMIQIVDEWNEDWTVNSYPDDISIALVPGN